MTLEEAYEAINSILSCLHETPYNNIDNEEKQSLKKISNNTSNELVR